MITNRSKFPNEQQRQKARFKEERFLEEKLHEKCIFKKKWFVLALTGGTIFGKKRREPTESEKNTGR